MTINPRRKALKEMFDEQMKLIQEEKDPLKRRRLSIELRQLYRELDWTEE